MDTSCIQGTPRPRSRLCSCGLCRAGGGGDTGRAPGQRGAPARGRLPPAPPRTPRRAAAPGPCARGALRLPKPGAGSSAGREPGLRCCPRVRVTAGLRAGLWTPHAPRPGARQLRPGCWLGAREVHFCLSQFRLSRFLPCHAGPGEKRKTPAVPAPRLLQPVAAASSQNPSWKQKLCWSGVRW